MTPQGIHVVVQRGRRAAQAEGQAADLREPGLDASALSRRRGGLGLLTMAEAARELRYTDGKTALRFLRRHGAPLLQLGPRGGWRIRLTDLEALLQRWTVGHPVSVAVRHRGSR
ncbi:MAG: hypothetical protein AB7G23_02865 [Vicinamibacterales bacterium]